MNKDNGRSPLRGSDQRPFGVEPPSGVSSIAATPNAAHLTDLEKRVLGALEEGRHAYAPFGHACYSFASVARASGVARHLVRRIVRSVARKGLAEFHKGLWSEDGEPRGAGYGLSQAGCDWIDEARKAGGCYAHVADEYGDFCVHCHQRLASAAGARSAETAQPVQSVGRQSGDAEGSATPTLPGSGSA